MSRSVLIGPETWLMGPCAALVVAAPAAVRIAAGGQSFFAAWLAVAGVLVVPILAALALARVARRVVASRGPITHLWVGVAVWTLLALPVDLALGAGLMATTHQRALGGSTFALVVVVTQTGALVVALRVRRWVIGLPSATAQRISAWATALALVALVVVTAIAMAAGQEPSPLVHHQRVVLLDACLAIAAVVTAVAIDLPSARARAASWVGGASVGALVAAAVVLLAGSPDLPREVTAQTPLLFAAIEALGLGPTSHPGHLTTR